MADESQKPPSGAGRRKRKGTGGKGPSGNGPSGKSDGPRGRKGGPRDARTRDGEQRHGSGRRRGQSERRGAGEKRGDERDRARGGSEGRGSKGPHGKGSGRSGRGPAPRRALAQRGLPTQSRGAKELVDVLERAWRAADADPDILTHGFHSYPARMHPLLAREVLSLRDGVVLDPFCGSGTVLVEAMRQGRRAVGTDLNPVAIRLAEAKTSVPTAVQREDFAALIRDVAERSEARVRARVPVRAPLSRQEAAWYEGHTLKELGGLLEEIQTTEDAATQRLLEMIFSAIVVKFSRQRADTAERVVDKRIRKGLPTEFFVRRGVELCERWARLEEETAKGAVRPRVRPGDARQLPKLMPKGLKADLILTSPPYGGTYDYVDHHARRYPWLGLDAGALRSGEIGARRHSGGQGATRRWDRELGDSLAAMNRVMASDGLAVLLMGDGLLDGEAVPADAQVQRLAPRAAMKLVAVASQPRPDWLGGAMRREHLLVLEKTGEAPHRAPKGNRPKGKRPPRS